MKRKPCAVPTIASSVLLCPQTWIGMATKTNTTSKVPVVKAMIR